MNTVIDEIYSKQICRVNWNTQIDFNFLGNNFQFYYRFLEKFQSIHSNRRGGDF